MILSPALAFAALAVLPSDRMAIADRLFDRGQYADARAEYAGVRGGTGVKEDEILYRLAECDRALGKDDSARSLYGELLRNHPLSRHAPRARLRRALLLPDAERRAELKLLDTDATAKDVRASALYHLGVITKDASCFARSLATDPEGRYAGHAKFRHAAALIEASDAEVRRTALGELLEVAFGKDPALAREAHYLAATRSYAEKRYGEAASLCRRYLKQYPDDRRANAVLTMSAWSDYLSGKYASAAALSAAGGSDDFAYLTAASSYALGEGAKAKTLLQKYLEDYPQGRYRKAAELPLARMDFEDAEKRSDPLKAVESARRSADLSHASSDRLRLAWALEKAGREDDADAEYVGIARDFPKTDDAAEALFRRAMVLLRAQKWSAADLSLAEALASGKNARRKAESLYWRGVAASNLGHAAEGAAFFREAVKEGVSLDQSREARLAIADFEYKSGNLAAAKDAYAQLVREGACARMSAAKTEAVGRFLLSCPEGAKAFAEAKTCAKSLAENGKSAEWRQAAFALEGEIDEQLGEYAAATDAYRRAMTEKVRTEPVRRAALRLGELEYRAGEFDRADATLREAVTLNAEDARSRASAYLLLAKNAAAKGDAKNACSYATVVKLLFDDKDAAAEAEKILKQYPRNASSGGSAQ